MYATSKTLLLVHQKAFLLDKASKLFIPCVEMMDLP